MGRSLVAGLLLAVASLAQAEVPATADALFAATLNDLNDRPAALAAWKGKPMIVNFWARWCGPCRTEIPELVKLRAARKSQGLEVMGIAIEEQAESVRDFAKAYDMDYPVLVAEDKGIPLMQALGNSKTALPFTIAIDRNGRIVAHKLGPLKGADLEAAAAAALR